VKFPRNYKANYASQRLKTAREITKKTKRKAILLKIGRREILPPAIMTFTSPRSAEGRISPIFPIPKMRFMIRRTTNDMTPAAICERKMLLKHKVINVSVNKYKNIKALINK
jgi:hypothetical protein